MSDLLARLPPRNVHGETKLVVGLVSTSHFVNHMYLVLLPPVFALLVAEFDVTLTELGVALGVMGFFGMICQLPFGYLSDNYGRTLTLGIGLTTAAVGTFVLAFAPSIDLIYVGQAMLGIGIAAHHPAHFPMLSDATPEEHLGRVFSIHGFAGNLGYAAAPAIVTGVLAFQGLTWRHALLVVGVLGGTFAVVAIVLLARYVSVEVTNPAGREREAADYSLGAIRDQVVSEMRSLFTSPAILAFALLALVTAMTNWGLRSYAVVLLADGYGLSLNAANAVLTLMFVASAVLILAGGELSDRLSARLVILASYGVVVASSAAVATLLLPVPLAMVAVVLAGGALTMGGPAKDKLINRLSMRGDLGKNFAIITVGVQFGGTVAPPMFGAIIDTTGLELAFYTVAGFALLGSLVIVAILRTYRESLAVQPAAEPGD